MKKFALGFILSLILSFSLSPLLVFQVEATENSWKTMADMPTARTGLGVAVVNGKIYAIGGYRNGYLNINKEYDPATNTWTPKTPMPTPRWCFGIATYQNKIYVIGGIIGFDSAKGKSITCALNEVYDPLTDTWETKTQMPTDRSQLNAMVVNGKIYLIGGRTGGQYSTVSLNEVYDPLTNSWTTKKPIPYPVVEYASAVVDNKIYVIGGQDEFHDPKNLDLNQIYYPETDTWSFGAPIPTVVLAAAAGATTGVLAPKRIYVIGGMPDKSLDAVRLNQVYNPESHTWSTGAPMPTARCNLAVAVVNDMLYAIGGVPNPLTFPFNTENEQYTPFGFGTVPPPDTTSPTVSIVSPENKTYTVKDVPLTFTVSESTSWIRYSLDGQANVRIAGNTTITGLSDGPHSLVIYATDTARNTGYSKTIYFSIAQQKEPKQPETEQSEPFPTTLIVTAIVMVAVVGAALLIYFVKVRKTTGKTEIISEGVM